MKKILACILLVLVLLITTMGCVSLAPNQATLQEFQIVKTKYAPNAFPITTGALGDYITELSILRARSSLSVAKVVDAELNATQAFYYYNLAINEMSALDFDNCDAKIVNQTESFLVLSKGYSENAIVAYGALSEAEKNYLIQNQAELNEYLLQSSIAMSDEILDNC